jgi:hypothetical protein
MPMNSRDMPVRFTRLKYMAESPKKYLWALGNAPDSDELLLGRCTHMLVLGGDKFVVYKKRRIGKEWEEFHDRNKAAGIEVVTQKIWDQARWMADSVLGDELAMAHLMGERELQIDWTFCGRPCSSRLDSVSWNGGYITDLKTTAVAKPAAFKAMVKRYAYHAQLAWYREAARWLAAPQSLIPPDQGFIVAVEKKPPYDVVTFEVTQDLLEQGMRMCRLWFEQLMACEASDSWPGYSQCVVPIEPDEEEPDLIFENGGDDDSDS